MASKTFSVIGITDYKGKYKVRFTNDMYRRLTRCAKDGAQRLDFVSLPFPMSKVDALKYMLSLPEFQSPEDHTAIKNALLKRDKSIQESGPKPRRGRPPSKAKITTLKDILEAINE